MMRRLAFVAGIAVLVALAASPTSAAHWNVDYGRSRLGFRVSWGEAPYIAQFHSWKADIEFDPADLAHSRAVVDIDVASETSDDNQTDDGVKGAQGFAADRFPTAHFETTGFAHRGGSDYVVTGTVSIKSITRAVTLPFTLTLSGASAHMTGQARLSRADFHVGTGTWAKPDPVAYEVTVNIDLVATKAGP
jgi:polyisoprenoid-binding protein YceI